MSPALLASFSAWSSALPEQIKPRQLGGGGKVVGCKFDDPAQVPGERRQILLLLVDLGERLPGRQQVVLALEGVAELDAGFDVVLLVEIALAALVIGLCAFLARAAAGEQKAGHAKADAERENFDKRIVEQWNA